jgi:nitroreductase
MDVRNAIETRRAYRSLDPVEITDALVRDLADCARLAPSCFNNQPWRFVFVRDPAVLGELHTALSSGNEWAEQASMIVGVYSKKEYDCDIKGREYFLFGTGMATAFLVLRATELGLVAHPIAGYKHARAKEILNVPEEMTLITLVMVGERSGTLNPALSEKQRNDEAQRPNRMTFEEFAHFDRVGDGGSEPPGL